MNLCLWASGVCMRLWYWMSGHISSPAPLFGCFLLPSRWYLLASTLGPRPFPSACAHRLQIAFRGSKTECCPEGNRIKYKWSRRHSRKQAESLGCTSVLWRAACWLMNSQSSHRREGHSPLLQSTRYLHLQTHLKNKVRLKYLLLPSDMCLSEPASALFSVGKAALPGLHHTDASSHFITLSASKQNQSVLYASIIHLALQIGERCGLVQVKRTLISSAIQYLPEVFNNQEHEVQCFVHH